MNCAVGSREKTSPTERRRNSLTLTGGGNGLALAGLLAGVLLAGTTLVDAQNTPPAGSATTTPTTPAAAPAAKKSTGKTPTKNSTADANTPKMQGSYAIGVSIGTTLRNSGVTPDTVSSERIMQGVREALSGKVQMSQEYQQSIMALLRGAHEAQVATRTHEAEPNHAAAVTFLAENGKKKDIVTTASGLQYKVITPGSGGSPEPGDMVTVNYRGTLLNGTEFDSSAKHGGPATFPSNGVIPGWQEALKLMKPGSKYQLFIPPKLAYDLESPPTIPPGSLLIFDVELVSVKPEAATPPVHPQIAPPQPAAPKPQQK